MAGRTAGTRAVRVGLATLAAMVPAAATAHAQAQDSVIGGYTFAITAGGGTGAPLGSIDTGAGITSGPLGESPAGSLSVRVASGYSSVYEVQCLKVTGNQAVVVGSYVPGRGPIGNGVLKLAVVDNGPGFDPLAYRFVPGTPAAPLTCDTTADLPPFETGPRPATGPVPFPTTLTSSADQPPLRSDFTVVDAQPVTENPAPGPGTGTGAGATPTSKRDCKRGGYARFGFANQGRCIQAVKRTDQ